LYRVLPDSNSFCDRRHRLAVLRHSGGGKGGRAILSASCFVKSSAKLFDKGACRRQIRKAPAIEVLVASPSGAAKSEWDAARLVKADDLTVQFDI
jgi:hypothetical protein